MKSFLSLNWIEPLTAPDLRLSLECCNTPVDNTGADKEMSTRNISKRSTGTWRVPGDPVMKKRNNSFAASPGTERSAARVYV